MSQDPRLPVPRLDLPEAELQRRFDALQDKLVPLWKSISKLNRDEQTIVVVPSVSLDFALRGSEMQAYEERLLFMLFLLRQPRARLVYVTSMPVPDETIEYYLSLLPGVVPSHARERLFMVPVADPDPVPLTHKVLQRPRVMQRIRDLVIDPDKAHLVPFNTTWAERDLALRLGIPMYGNDPRHDHLGTKSGSRETFKQAGVPLPFGLENLRTREDIVAAIREVLRNSPDCPAVVLKLDAAVSGEGNAMVSLDGIGAEADDDAILAAVMAMKPELTSLSADAFLERFARIGGVVEARIVAKGLLSPSVQMRVTPLGAVELLSTHDQLLGGVSGQSYLGARFPAADAYASLIAGHALKIGHLMAERGVLGRFAVDFLVAEQDGEWACWAIEINLRKGGTTHPFLTLQFLTNGRYDWERNRFETPRGEAKYLVASDHVESPAFRRLVAGDLYDVLVSDGLHYDNSTQRGIVLHMLPCLGDCGRFGLTAVGDTVEDAEFLYDHAFKQVTKLAAAAAEDAGLAAD